jgi:hypothetical protein
MSIAPRKRLEALERRQPRARPWVDPFPSIERLWPDLEAVAKGRACWRKRPEAEWPEEASAVQAAKDGCLHTEGEPAAWRNCQKHNQPGAACFLHEKADSARSAPRTRPSVVTDQNQRCSLCSR